MDKNKKESLILAVKIFKETIIQNNCSLAVTEEDLYIFDTFAYVDKQRYEGVRIPLKNLVMRFDYDDTTER